jgi:hypothetical protein
MYTHNHSPAYNFLQDGPTVTVTQDRATGAPTAPTQVRGESGKRLMQHYLDNTDPDLIVIELDLYWGPCRAAPAPLVLRLGGQPGGGHLDPLALVAQQTKRFTPVRGALVGGLL